MIIWIASYPRSGNTYLRVLLKHYFDLNTYSAYETEPELAGESPRPGSILEMAEADQTFFVKTHDLPQDSFPAVYLVRDGRDALVSYAHFILTYERQDGTMVSPEAYRQTLADLIVYNASFGGWGKNVRAWTERPAPTAVLRFEDLISAANPLPMVRRALAEVGYSAGSAGGSGGPPSFSDLQDRAPKFFRRGEIGGWKSQMRADVLEHFWEEHGAMMHRLGYAIPLEIARRQWARPQDAREASRYAALQEKLQEKEKIIRANEETIHGLARQLRAAESLVQEAQKFRGSRSYWLEHGPFSGSRFYQAGVRAMRQLLLLLFPSPVFELRQYTPRPVSMPPRYALAAKPAPELPSIRIVTPSYDQGDYIDDTIYSVVSQDYPNLQYVVQDGGSTDQTVRILEAYDSRLTYWESRPDGGQARAVNLGFQHAEGDIMAFLNSDDALLPGALNYVASYFVRHPEVDVIYGHRIIVDENGLEVGRWILPPHAPGVLFWADYVPQETLFWRRRVWEEVGGALDTSFKFALDWDLLLRFQQAGAVIRRVPRFLALFRAHPGQKTTAQMAGMGVEEMDRIRLQYLGRRVSEAEIGRRVKRYQQLSVIYRQLYRAGILRY